MGTGYIRQDVANNIADGNVANAADIDGEFDALETAFSSGSGHTHDGTAAEGGAVTVLGPAQEYVADGTNFRPKADNTYDLGSATFEWKDLYIDGTANIDNIAGTTATFTGLVTFTTGSSLVVEIGSLFTGQAEFDDILVNGGEIQGTPVGTTTPAAAIFTTLQSNSNTIVGGTLTVNGNTTLGNAATDTVTITADVASNIIPSADNTYDLGASGSEWKDLYIDGTANIDSLVADTAALTTVTGTVINFNNSTTNLNNDVNLGDLTTDTITANGRFDSDLTPTAAGTYDLGAPGNEWENLYAAGTVDLGAIQADSIAVTGLGDFNGDVDLGNAGTDSITFTGRIDSDVLPIADSTHDLGSSSLAWAEIHADDVIVGGESVLPTTGTWAVVISDSSGNNSSTTVTGYYYSIADLVFCTFTGVNNIDTTGLTGTDQLRISLPFTARASYTSSGTVQLSSADSGTSGQDVIITVNPGQSYARIIYNGGAATAATVLIVNDINTNVCDLANFSLVFVKA